MDAKGRVLSNKCIAGEVPFEIPDSWVWARLENCCENIVDCPHSTPQYLAAATGFTAIDTNCMDDNWNLTDLRNLSEESYKRRTGRYVPRPGDIIFSREGSIGRSVILDSECVCLGQRVMILNSNPKILLNRYCQVVLSSPYAWGLYLAGNVGTGVKHINVSMVKGLFVPLPPLAEQRRIVERVDELMPLVEEYGALEDAREELDAALSGRLRKSVLQMAVQGKLVPQDSADEPASELLERIREQRRKLVADGKAKFPKGGESIIYTGSDGRRYEKRIDAKGRESEPACIEDGIPFEIPDSWEWTRLETLGAIVGGGTPKTGVSEFWSNGASGIPWITPADMSCQSNTMVSAGKRFISSVGLEKSSAQLLPTGSVLMSSRAPIGYLGIAANPIATNQGFKSVVLIDIALNRWLICTLEALMNSIVKRASGTTFKEISGTEFGGTLIPLPPLEEQARILESCKSVLATITSQ